MTDIPCLLDELETADMLEIDGLHAWQFQLDDALLDRAEAAADAGEPFASEEVVLRIECVDGRERRHWAFSYNQTMEASRADDGHWQIGEHRLTCLGAVVGEGDD